MAKIGRNSPCPCGSGKKYKRCHGSDRHTTLINAVAQKAYQKAKVEKIQRERQQGLGRPIISAEFQGYRLVAVKNRLMYSKGWKTFHDFLFDYIKAALGTDWGNTELSKPLQQRHPILVWYHLLCEFQKSHFTEQGRVNTAPMTGATAAYLHLAYDLYALDHNAELQAKLVQRLRNHDNFEGARYEVFVAASLIRAGFEIAFENEDDRSTSHCEFTAMFKRTRRQFSVEAKHRQENTKFRLGRQLNRALFKDANHARIVFLDINVPDTTEDEMNSRLNSALADLRAFEGRRINGKPLPNAYLFVTNTPWHHHLESAAPRCCVMVDGFQIPDFKGDIPAPSLRAAIEARERHVEMHELLKSMQDHAQVPSTFDGSIPEFSFGSDLPRLLIGQNYLVVDEQGMERSGLLTTATVAESEKKAYCGLTLDNGKSVICAWPLSEAEMAAWYRHPDTFFGEVGQRTAKIDSPLGLYDFFLGGYRQTPKERLLELMVGAPDYAKLVQLDQPNLASIYAERCVYIALASQKQSVDSNR